MMMRTDSPGTRGRRMMPAMTPADARAEPTHPPPHPDRLSRLTTRFEAAGADVMLITSPADVAYLTGFLGGDSWLLAGAGRPVVVSDFRYQEELDAVGPVADVFIRTTPMLEAAVEVLASRRWQRLAVQAEAMPVADFEALTRRLGRDRLLPTTGLVAELRRRKDAHEITLIRHAIRIQEKALRRLLPRIRPGQTELEIAAALEAEMKSLGASEPGFRTIVAARANASLPHYRPGGVRIRKNDLLLIDWGAVVEGYHGDMTRTFALGSWPGKFREIYQIVLDAQMSAAAALAPGRSAHEVDAIARDHIRAAGYGDFFGHGLGHGLGLNGHEDPRLNPLFPDTTLTVGDVVTVEPGIYIPGRGGVRLEDVYVITGHGAENLCSLKKGPGFATLD